jgi:hypothetical protein
MAVTQANERLIKFGALNDEIASKKFYVQKIVWLKPTTTGHDLVLSNTAGKVVYQAACNAGDVGGMHESDFDAPLLTEGIKVTTLGSGTVDVYIV